MDAASPRPVKAGPTRGVALVIGSWVVTTVWGPAWAEDPVVAAPTAKSRGLQSLLQQRVDGEGETLTIESDALEIESLPDGGRMVTFERAVRVRQGALRLRADRLVAHYAPQEPEPRRLVAYGSVEIDQPGQQASCAEAEYSREDDRLTCRGGARLIQGCDVVAGESIEFDLSTDRARVKGAARVVIAPRQADGGCATATTPPGEAP